MILIDAHGPDHGLYVAVSNGKVEIKEWAECCEPDEHGSYSPHIYSAEIKLADLLDPNGKHYDCGHVDTGSMHGKIVNLACNWLGFYGGTEDYVDDDDRPCQHFGMNYSGIGARRTGPWPAHMKCDTCGQMPE